MKKFLLASALLSMMITVGCTKETDTPTDNSGNNNGGNNNGGFSPPTTNTFMIDGTEHTASMDAVSGGGSNGQQVGVSKPFSNVTRGNLNIHFYDSVNVRNKIPEGGYKEFIIDTVYGADNSRVQVQLDVEAGDYYYLKVQSGKLYISKKDGKLRWTLDGEKDAVGPKWTGSGFSSEKYTRKLKFSIEQGAQF